MVGFWEYGHDAGYPMVTEDHDVGPRRASGLS